MPSRFHASPEVADRVRGNRVAWHALTPDDALAGLQSNHDGLSEDEAASRLARFGPNEIREQEEISRAAILLRQLASPLIYILVIAGIVSAAVGEYIDASFIGAVIAVDAVIGFFQEYGAEQSVAALRRLAVTRARVVRGGREHEIDSRMLVPGDVVVIESGMRVPADARLLSSHALEADESLLTGESAPVDKSAAPVSVESPLADRTSMLHMGSAITRGRGRSLIVATAGDTAIGAISGSLAEIEKVEAPVQRRMAQFARVVAAVAFAVFLIGLTIGLARGESLHDLFFTLVALTVSAIPEGLPVVLTVTFAVGVSRMAARNVIIRRLPAVETLGSCTVIGSDKTGTLTQNRMTVAKIFAGGREYDVTGTGYESAGRILARNGASPEVGDEPLRMTLIAGALNNTATAVPADGTFDVAGDPTEIALLVSAFKFGLARDELEDEWPLEAEIPFDSERRYSATYHRHGSERIVFVKGAAERVVSMCSASAGAAFDPTQIHERAEEMAAQGLRVLAFAEGSRVPATDAPPGEQDLRDLTFLGLQGMIDPLRPEALVAVSRCRSAGIRVLMITGDHPVTATAIGRELGMLDQRTRAISGAELHALDAPAFESAVRERNAFARVSPEQKLRIVEMLRAQGATVAVTGDGVNDAPALKAADIGVAMGATGTDVAKEAADMVVTDDNFASVFAAVEEGRVVFDNIRKVTFFLISAGAGEVLAVLSSLLFGFRLPFLPAQLLWLNLVTNGVQDVALAFEPPDPDILDRPPRPRREGVMSRLLWERTVLVGIVLAAGTIGLFLLELHLGGGSDRARTVAITTMVMFQVFHVGNSRSERLSAFQKDVFSNRFLFVGTAVSLIVHIAALYLPFTQYVLRFEPLGLWEWARIVPVAASVIVAVEIDKFLRRRHAASVSWN